MQPLKKKSESDKICVVVAKIPVWSKYGWLKPSRMQMFGMFRFCLGKGCRGSTSKCCSSDQSCFHYPKLQMLFTYQYFVMMETLLWKQNLELLWEIERQNEKTFTLPFIFRARGQFSWLYCTSLCTPRGHCIVVILRITSAIWSFALVSLLSSVSFQKCFPLFPLHSFAL